MLIVKSDGRVATYDTNKVRRSIERSGLVGGDVVEVVQLVESQIKDGMTTKELYEIVYQELNKRGVKHAGRYSLKNGILRLGPAGFKFEKYVASILRAYDYSAQNPDQELKGSCVHHEVDVVAEKDNKNIFIEAKFRNDFQGIVRLKDIMATWARFLDLVDGATVGTCQHFDEPWVVTNGRFSNRSRQFGVCKGMRLIGWNFPEERTFAMMVDKISYYPVTVIPEISTDEVNTLSKHGLMLCCDLAKIEPEELSKRIDISEKRAELIISSSSQICE